MKPKQPQPKGNLSMSHNTQNTRGSALPDRILIVVRERKAMNDM